LFRQYFREVLIAETLVDNVKPAKFFATSEFYPVIKSLKAANDWLGIEAFQFTRYALA